MSMIINLAKSIRIVKLNGFRIKMLIKVNLIQKTRIIMTQKKRNKENKNSKSI